LFMRGKWWVARGFKKMAAPLPCVFVAGER
jgi:hypothetical protein